MKHYTQLLKNVRHYLAYQIFASFWITLAILLAISFVLPTLDSRAFSSLDQSNRTTFELETLATRRQYNLDEIFERHLSVETPHHFNTILLEPKTGVVVGADPKNVKALQVFIYRGNNPEKPLKRRFDSIEIVGPFQTHSDKREYLQYFVQKVNPQQEIFNYFFDSPWIMLLLLLGISTPILLWLARKIATPVKALRLSANAVALGDLSINPKLETEGINELREVGKSFNQMIKALQDLTHHQQRMLSDISHELKTPLARLQLAAAILRRRTGESAELTRIENEIQKLNTMIYDLLALSRQQLDQHLKREIFSVNKIWDDILEDAKFETEQNHLHLTLSQRIAYPERYFINGNMGMLASAMENIIRNAQKYAAHNIKVLTYVDKKELVIAIDDDGPGVSESEYEQIFRPFYRVDEARARQTGGTGLGLAIVANAVQQHQGSVKAMKSTTLGGLRVEIRLPLWIE